MSENMESAIAGAISSAVCPWEEATTAVSVSVCPWDDEDPPSTSKQTARQYLLTLCSCFQSIQLQVNFSLHSIQIEE